MNLKIRASKVVKPAGCFIASCLFALPTFAGDPCTLTTGPDIIVGDIYQVISYDADGTDDAFSFGTTACNMGDADARWIRTSTDHPVIAQNLYKLKDNRFEQIGMSWLKHGFFVDTTAICCPNQCEDAGTDRLGPGCSDTYSASLNGSQGRLGPRWQVNAATGSFTYPPANPPFPGDVARRLRVSLGELEPSSADVKYFVEIHYIAFDDTLFGNQMNSASYRRVIMTQDGKDFDAALAGSTVRESAGVYAWADTDPEVAISGTVIPDDGRFILAAKAWQVGKEMWHYEYALENYNSDRCGASFAVPLPTGTVVSNTGFHDVAHHSFDGLPHPKTKEHRNFDSTDWLVTQTKSTLRWQVMQTHAQDPNANALRWGSLYNFRFESNKAPTCGDITLGLFKPGTPSSVKIQTIIPGPLDGCPGDLDTDNIVNVNDLIIQIGKWGPCPQPCPPACIGDITRNDCQVNVNDLLDLLCRWGSCP